MSKVVLLGLTVLFSAVFLIVPANNDAPRYALFTFNPSAEISIQSYVYFGFEHLTLMALAFIIASEARQFRLTCRTFFYLQVADFIDYLLTYNEVWFNLGLLPISMNVIRMATFVTVVLIDGSRRDHSYV